jgi:hypothetical protein
MSYIIKSANALINAKLTDKGREKLAKGQLDFQTWAFGDSEIDYYSLGTSFDYGLNSILRPMDDNPDLKYRIPQYSTSSGFTQAITNLQLVEKKISNTAKTRGFFTGDTTNGFTAFTSTDYVYSTFGFAVTSLTGGTCLTVTGGTFSVDNIGDYVMLKISNPFVTGSTSSAVIEENTPIPYLMYKIESVTTGVTSDYICVDRDLPNFAGIGGTISGFGILYPGGDSIQNYYGSGSTTPYWNEDTLSFDSNCDLGVADVDVWNMNITNSLPIAGVSGATYEDFTRYGSTAFTGSKLYFDLTINDANNTLLYSQPAVGLIHYTNNTIANFYGEKLYVNAPDNAQPVLQLPTIMYDGNDGTTIGLTLTTNTTPTSQLTGSTENPNFGLVMYPLEGPDGRTVGYTMPDQKMFVISDMEINSVMSYKANRNWTLPQAGATLQSVLSQTTASLPTGYEMYISYLFTTTSGYTTGLHCQNYQVISSLAHKDVKVNITQGLDYLKPGLSGSFGEGFEATGLQLIFQKVATGNAPDPSGWLISDVTNSLSAGTPSYTSGDKINPATVYTTSFTIDNAMYTGATAYDLNDYITIPTLAQPDNLNFGDERFFYGNVETEIAATVWKSHFSFIGNTNEFTTSVNPTFDPTASNVYISEVGVYDSSGDLVVIGKISTPIMKDLTKTIIVQLEIDF